MTSCFGFDFGLEAIGARLQRFVRREPKPSTKRRSLQISAPFNFVHETAHLPGRSDDEVAMLKEQALTQRLEIQCSPAGSIEGGSPTSGPGTAPRRPAPPAASGVDNRDMI